MFFCGSCKEKNGWPGVLPQSYGKCEVCGETSACYSVKSADLPVGNLRVSGKAEFPMTVEEAREAVERFNANYPQIAALGRELKADLAAEPVQETDAIWAQVSPGAVVVTQDVIDKYGKAMLRRLVGSEDALVISAEELTRFMAEQEPETVETQELCGAQNADYPGEFSCEMPKGHDAISALEEGVVAEWDHAAPSKGAWWNG